MSKNILRLKKGMVLPNQDLLELEISNFINKSTLGKTYTTDKNVVEDFISKNASSGYRFHDGDGVYLLDDDYEIIIRKVSKKRKENESAERIKKMLQVRSTDR